ncbi:SDR family NAD(P)-dependent oxidoreductase [Herbaspirillum sp. alder98]|uniref:SDR family NAD(P)-dependent oxidoreductase n=1 Tax=Herbaspirillum sp. alder98 TaxID=2913096 RepID=UPI001CD896B2|nr:SDR family NAD(P)-dependent oxidoreductase [Herbaspirillum sp. alder98]MCA1326302.1 SDR family NAD(P)-dependent oxidoreductase [Herbaspirillum sp. alder98]
MDQTRDVFELNFFAAIGLVRLVLPYMRARRAGHIVNVTSIRGVVLVVFYLDRVRFWRRFQPVNAVILHYFQDV